MKEKNIIINRSIIIPIILNIIIMLVFSAVYKEFLLLEWQLKFALILIYGLGVFAMFTPFISKR